MSSITIDYLLGGGIKPAESQIEASNSLISKIGVSTNNLNFAQSASSGVSQPLSKNYFGGSPSGGIVGSMAAGNWKNSGT